MSSILSIAVSGLNSAASRVANAAANIVNVSSTSKLPASRNDPYTGFTPQDPINQTVEGGNNPLGVTTTFKPRDPAFVPAYDPNSPFANDQGLVATPNVDLNVELISSKEAQVTYTATAKLIKISQDMEKSLLDAMG